MALKTYECVCWGDHLSFQFHLQITDLLFPVLRHGFISEYLFKFFARTFKYY